MTFPPPAQFCNHHHQREHDQIFNRDVYR
jgi:hypothetical protein